MLRVGDGVGSTEGGAVVAGAVAGLAVGSGDGDEQAAARPATAPNRPTIAPSKADRRAERIAPVYHGQHGGLSRTQYQKSREAIAALGSRIDAAAVTAIWNEVLQAPSWQRPPVWIHGDLAAGNLLVNHGRLNAVIDFGCVGLGDPAVDLLVAWNPFPAEARKVYRVELDIDDATWIRGRGWAL